MARNEGAGDAGLGRAGTAELRLFDMHCHLDRVADARQVANDAAGLGLTFFCAPVSPADALAAREVLGGCANVRVGAGLHPWWIDDGSCDERALAEAARLAGQSRFVGEVGLDFGRAHAASRELQLGAFERICRACAESPRDGRVFSIHAVRSVDEALDLLERYGLTTSATCIFHWFSGTSDELARARRLGCLFSVNEMMLATRKGREYARQVPLNRLLLETDYPPELDAPCPAEAIAAALGRTLDKLAEIRSADRTELARAIAQTSARLLDL